MRKRISDTAQKPSQRHAHGSTTEARYGVARVLSKRGLCSRSQAETWVREGRVRLDGRLVRDPEFRVPRDAVIFIDDQQAAVIEKRYFMLNKPRGVVCTNADERARQTVRDLMSGLALPHLSPVGRLDQASEGLLLLSNDSQWAASITEPSAKLNKTYHVQIDAMPEQHHIAQWLTGIQHDADWLTAHQVRLIRSGGKTAWLEFVLREGKNRQIRRMCAALGFDVQRLIRVKIGELQLGELAKAQWRELSKTDLALIFMSPEESIAS